MNEDFSVQVGRWCELAGSRARQAFLAIGYGALTSVKQKTPVRTGYLRANWQLVRDGAAVPIERAPRQKNLNIERDLLATGANIAGGMAGWTGGAAAGAAIGSAFGGVGAVPGAAIGGVVGGLAGSFAGSEVAQRGVEAAYDAANTREEVSDVRLGEKLVIVNPTSYARAIEYGRQVRGQDGAIRHMAGRGMMQQTIAEMPQIAAMAVAPFVRGG